MGVLSYAQAQMAPKPDLSAWLCVCQWVCSRELLFMYSCFQRNEELRVKVFGGEVLPAELVSMTPTQLATAEQQKQYAKIHVSFCNMLLCGVQGAMYSHMFSCYLSQLLQLLVRRALRDFAGNC